VALPSLLAVFAHPDDESLSAGGLLARHASSGARTTVLTATWSADSTRAAELSDATRTLGAGEPRMLGYADARAPGSAPGRARLLDAPVDEVAARIVAHVRDLRPEVVVTHDAYGGATGHPDHVRTHEATVRAARAAGDARQHPEAGPPWSPYVLLLATHPHSARQLLADSIGPRKALHTTPDPDAEPTDVTPWLDRKVAAILCHRTEVERGALPGQVAAMTAEQRRTLLGTEWYVRSDRPPGAGSP
jgi:N-acetyl-1-D-myo-inositol-2-amino-2-deoxy-alpha-D-glucopyranoside deacetylase